MPAQYREGCNFLQIFSLYDSIGEMIFISSLFFYVIFR